MLRGLVCSHLQEENRCREGSDTQLSLGQQPQKHQNRCLNGHSLSVVSGQKGFCRMAGTQITPWC